MLSRGPQVRLPVVGPAPRGGEFYRGLLSRPACETCVLRGSTIVPPEGRIGARIAFVGEAPAREEVRQGRPFVGDSGRLLDLLLEKLGIRRDDCWITNGALCPIRTVAQRIENPDGTTKAVKMLDEQQVTTLASASCRSRLVEELKIVAPRVIVALGRPALSTIRGAASSIKKRRGGIEVIEL